VLIGYILLIPSVIGMCFALMTEAWLLSASTNVQSREGAGIIAMLGTGFIGFAFVVSLIGGLLGWLLVVAAGGSRDGAGAPYRQRPRDLADGNPLLQPPHRGQTVRKSGDCPILTFGTTTRMSNTLFDSDRFV
jgi:hypothetical protein